MVVHLTHLVDVNGHHDNRRASCVTQARPNYSTEEINHHCIQAAKFPRVFFSDGDLFGSLVPFNYQLINFMLLEHESYYEKQYSIS